MSVLNFDISRRYNDRLAESDYYPHAFPAGRIQQIHNSDGLHLRNITKSFKQNKVLKGINLTFENGEFIAILGKSGCGKSTLLRIIAGLEQADSGSLHLGASDYQTTQTRIMFQEPRLLPWLDITDNVAIGLENRKDKRQAREKAITMLKRVGLDDKANAWPAALSGGQKQRVALARALISKPQFLAFDEPLGALDALTRLEMQRLLENIWQERQFTAILVTHDVMEAVQLADRVIILKDGHASLDLKIDLPRPRRQTDSAALKLTDLLLQNLMESHG